MARRVIGTIRIAGPEDAPSLASMHVASWRETYAGLLPDLLLSSLSVEARKALWDQIFRQPEQFGATTVHLVEHDGDIIGFGSCGSQRTENLTDMGYDGEISAIYVLKAFQGQGAGRRLLLTMASDLLTRGFGGASLWVLRENQMARRFYERQGAQLIAERQESRKDAVLFEVAYGWAHLTDLSQLEAR